MAKRDHHRHLKNGFPSTPGQRLKYHRENRGLTQQALGDRVNLSKQAIEAYENGRRKMSVEAIELISKEFDLTPNHFMVHQDFLKIVVQDLHETLEPEVHALVVKHFECDEFEKLLVALIVEMDSIILNRSFS